MSLEDYKNFVHKVEQLNKFIEIANKSSDKYNLLIKCKQHDEVVALAKKWGFDIGKRWGENNN